METQRRKGVIEKERGREIVRGLEHREREREREREMGKERGRLERKGEGGRT